jgi:hypothetical protein
MHPALNVTERQQTEGAVLPRRATLALLRAAPSDPRLAEHEPQVLDERDDAPRAARLAAFLVRGQLHRAEREVEMEPVECANLLLARRAIAGEPVGESVLQRQGIE